MITLGLDFNNFASTMYNIHLQTQNMAKNRIYVCLLHTWKYTIYNLYQKYMLLGLNFLLQKDVQFIATWSCKERKKILAESNGIHNNNNNLSCQFFLNKGMHYLYMQ